MQDEEPAGAIDRSQFLPDDEAVLTAARKLRRDVGTIEGKRGGREYRSLDRPLDFYLNRCHITPPQYSGGVKYFRLWNYSILRSRYTRMKFGDPGGEVDLEGLAIAPKAFFEAREAITSRHEREVVFRVCCMDVKAGKRGEMLWLRSGLDSLVKHFRITD